MRYFLLVMAMSITAGVNGQNIFRAVLKDSLTGEPLVGASAHVQGTDVGANSDLNGYLEIGGIPDGTHTVVFRYLGYDERVDALSFPLEDGDTLEYFLSPSDLDVEDVVISATRSSRSIDDLPTRVETISGEELDEKITMQPANVKMVLTESTGIQTQQTSASSANASIRIQGLDGKYTQLLKDGFPLYAGFSGGMSLLQIPPLDLRQVEVIKGSSSTLYGGGAIAGIINFVTKEPADRKELSVLCNANHTGALDMSGYYSQKFRKTGVTLLASQNLQKGYDADGDGLSDIPQFKRYNLNPRLFVYFNPGTTLSIGLNSGYETRTGGDMLVVRGRPDSLHSFFERNETVRLSTQVQMRKMFSDSSILTLKNSMGYFERAVKKPGYEFVGEQVSSFSEVSYLLPMGRWEWIFGGNLTTDQFDQTNASLFPLDYVLNVGGVFVQNSVKVSDQVVLESSMRCDVTNNHRAFVLPRLSAMYKMSRQITARIGGGLGYKPQTIFSEEASERSFKNLQPLNLQSTSPEQSIGGNLDFNYKTILFQKIPFSVNQLFFYTRLDGPLILRDSLLPNGNAEFVNADGYLDSRGFETNVKVSWEEVSFYCGYTFIDAVRHYGNASTANPLTAKSRIYMTLMYELEKRLRVGYELFYTGKQRLSAGDTRPGYWVMGLSAEWRFKHFSLFANAENFTDTRQTRTEGIYTGTLQNPQFREIWAPTDGFIFNVGFKINVWP